MYTNATRHRVVNCLDPKIRSYFNDHRRPICLARNVKLRSAYRISGRVDCRAFQARVSGARLPGSAYPQQGKLRHFADLVTAASRENWLKSLYLVESSTASSRKSIRCSNEAIVVIEPLMAFSAACSSD